VILTRAGSGGKNTFRLNGGTFNMEASVSLSPFIELGVLVSSNKGVNARITERVPQLYINASLMSAVNRDCNPIGDNDFESFDTAFVVDVGLNLTTIASIDLNLGHLANVAGFGEDSWEKILYTLNHPLMNQKCAIIADDHGAGLKGLIAGRELVQRDKSISSLIPAATGTLVPAASAVPTFDLTGIESYYSANGHLPTNVNYGQMIKATTVPANIKKAVQQAAKNGGLQRGFGVGGRCGTIFISVLVIFFVFL